MAWKADLVFESGEILTLEESFDTEEEAQEAGDYAASCYSQGTETLAMGGHDYSTDSVDYIDVYEE